MQSKIIFVVLFMLTFTIVHDSVITIIQKNDHTNIIQSMSMDVSKQECVECADMHKIHSMFHFVGLLMPIANNIILFEKERTPSYYLLQYTSLHKENTNKPPIV